MIQHIRKSILETKKFDDYDDCYEFSSLQNNLPKQQNQALEKKPNEEPQTFSQAVVVTNKKSNERVDHVPEVIIRSQPKLKSMFQKVSPLLQEISKRKQSECAGFALLNIVRMEFQRKQYEKYEKKLSQNVVNLQDPEDSEMVTKIMQKHKPTKREMQFVVQALITQPMFEQNSNMLLDIINNMSVFKEFKIEAFNPLQAIFQKGEVFCLITDQQAEGISTPSVAQSKLQRQSSSEQIQVRSRQNTECVSNSSKKAEDSGQSQQSPSIYQINQKDSMTYNEFIYLKNKYPLQKVTKIYKAGESFGEIALLTRGQRMGTMICRTDVEVISLTREGFNRIKGAWAETELNKKLNFLRKFSFFRGLSDSRLMSFLHLMEITNYEKENILYQKNAKSKFIYFIFEGQVQIFTYKVDDYPLLYQNQSRQLSNPEIQKYFKQTKPKLKKVPLMILSNGSYFAQFEMFEENEEIQTMAVIESERAVLFQIEINKFLDTMKGFNGDYDFKKDFKQKLLFEKERLENIKQMDSQIYQNVISNQNKNKYQDFTKLIINQVNNQQYEDQQDNKSSGRLDSNNNSILFENSQTDDNQDLRSFKSSQNFFKGKKKHRKQNHSLGLQKNFSEDQSQKYFYSVTSSPQLDAKLSETKSNFNRKLNSQENQENRKISSQESSRFFQASQLEVDFINESIQDELNGFLPEIKQKQKSLNYKGEMFRTRQNSQASLNENLIRKKNKSTSHNQLENNCQQLEQLEENKFCLTSRLDLDHSPLSSNSKVINLGFNDCSPNETLTQRSMQQSQTTENSRKNSIHKRNEYTPQSNRNGQIEREQLKSLFKNQIEQISHEKEQNLKILNYKDLNLKSIGISPSDLIEQCRKLQRFGFEKGQMSGQMKKTILAFTNRGLFSSIQDCKTKRILKENQDSMKKIKIKEEFVEKLDVSNEKNQELITDLSFKNSKIKYLLQKVKKQLKEDKNNSLSLQTDETHIQSKGFYKDSVSYYYNNKSNNNNDNFDKYTEGQSQFQNMSKSNSLNRQQRDELELKIRKFQELQNERNIQDNLEIKIKSPRIFPMRENLQPQSLSHSQPLKDLFQIKKFSFKPSQQNMSKITQTSNYAQTERNLINKESPYFPPSFQQEFKLIQEKKQRIESNNSNNFVAIANVRPYYTNNPGVPKNTFTDTQEQIKQYDKLKDYFLIERNYDTQNIQNQNLPQDKKQKEIIQNLMLSPRMNHLHNKQFDALKNMHLNRQKLKNHKRNKSLV